MMSDDALVSSFPSWVGPARARSLARSQPQAGGASVATVNMLMAGPAHVLYPS